MGFGQRLLIAVPLTYTAYLAWTCPCETLLTCPSCRFFWPSLLVASGSTLYLHSRQ